MADTELTELKQDRKMVRRLYTLLPLQVEKLKRLADRAGMNQSRFLRDLIDVEYVKRFKEDEPFNRGFYGQDN